MREKLIEEIGIEIFNYAHRVNPPTYTTAEDIIVRILWAVVDGMPLPDEAGRAVWQKQGDEDHIYDWAADVIESGARTFIALRKDEDNDS